MGKMMFFMGKQCFKFVALDSNSRYNVENNSGWSKDK